MLSKSILHKLPFQPPSPEELNVTYVRATKHRIHKESVLVLSLAAKVPCYYRIVDTMATKKMNRKVQGQLFLMKDGYLTLIYTDEQPKWSEAALERSEFPFTLRFCSEKEEELVSETLRKWGVEDGKVYRYQDMIQNKRRIRKHQTEIDKINGAMKKFGTIPKGYPRFIRDSVLYEDNYLFFDRKEKTGYCTYCGNEFSLPQDAKNNKDGRCPCCGRLFTWKSAGIGRGKLQAVRWSLLIQKRGNEFLFRYFRHVRSFKDYRNPQSSDDELMRVIATENDYCFYERGSYKGLEKTEWRYPVQKGYWWQYTSTWYEPEEVMLYNRNLADLFSGSWMQHSGAEFLMERGEWAAPYTLLTYMVKRYRERPFIEKLLKCGFRALANHEIEYKYESCLHSGNTLKEVLGVSKIAINLLREDEALVSHEQVSVMQTFEKKLNRAPSHEEWDILKQYTNRSYYNNNGIAYDTGRLIDLTVQLGNLPKIHRYLKSNGIRVLDYTDYISWLKELDCLSKFTLFPCDFQKAHDERAKEVAERRDKIKMEELKKFNRKLKLQEKKLEKALQSGGSFEKGIEGLMIRLPLALEELDKEGSTLRHCVSTYKQRVQNGETTIFFIRRLSDPDTPFYTLEWNHGSVVQCRGYRNCDPTPEVKALINVFTEQMHTNKKLAAFA